MRGGGRVGVVGGKLPVLALVGNILDWCRCNSWRGPLVRDVGLLLRLERENGGWDRWLGEGRVGEWLRERLWKRGHQNPGRAAHNTPS